MRPQECDEWIRCEMEKLAGDAAVDAVVFLSQMVRLWKDHCSQMLTIRSIFLYLDRTYVITSSSARSLFDMGLDLFRTHLQSHPEVSPFSPLHLKQAGADLCILWLRRTCL
jgi:cullin-4